MKTGMKNYAMMALTLFFVFSFAFSGVALATNHNGDTTPVEVKYLGELKNGPVFQVNIKNDDLDEYTITIRNTDGNILYTDRVNKKDYSQKFLVNVDEFEDGPIKVEVKSKDNKTADVYQIKTDNKFVQETSVTKL